MEKRSVFHIARESLGGKKTDKFQITISDLERIKHNLFYGTHDTGC